MNKLGNYIKDKMAERNNMPYEDFVKFGVSSTTVNNIVLNKVKNPKKISLSTFESIAKALNVNPQILIDLANDKDIDPELLTGKGEMYLDSLSKIGQELTEDDYIELPFYGAGIPCGNLKILSDYTEEKVKLPKKFARGIDFIARASGNSMIEEGIKENAWLLIVKQNHLNYSGDIMIVTKKDDGSLCRKVFYSEDKKGYVLKAANSNFEDEFIAFEDIILVGRVEGVYYKR